MHPDLVHSWNERPTKRGRKYREGRMSELACIEPCNLLATALVHLVLKFPLYTPARYCSKENTET